MSTATCKPCSRHQPSLPPSPPSPLQQLPERHQHHHQHAEHHHGVQGPALHGGVGPAGRAHGHPTQRHLCDQRLPAHPAAHQRGESGAWSPSRAPAGNVRRQRRRRRSSLGNRVAQPDRAVPTLLCSSPFLPRPLPPPHPTPPTPSPPPHPHPPPPPTHSRSSTPSWPPTARTTSTRSTRAAC